MNYDDANFGEIRRQLFYKKKLYGKVVYVIHRFYLSSKMCSCCGTIKTDLTLADRTYVCETCGMVKDRDLNAAINLDKVGRAHPEPTDACGHDGSVALPVSKSDNQHGRSRKPKKCSDHNCILLAEQEL